MDDSSEYYNHKWLRDSVSGPSSLGPQQVHYEGYYTYKTSQDKNVNIYPSGGLNASWTSALWMNASVDSAYTQEVLGELDSIKRIELVTPTDRRHVYLSKNHGWIELIPFYDLTEFNLNDLPSCKLIGIEGQQGWQLPNDYNIYPRLQDGDKVHMSTQ